MFRDDPEDARGLEVERIERRQIGAHGDRAGGHLGAGAQLGQAEQRADQALADGLEVAAALAKIGILDAQEGGPNLVEGPRDGPLGGEALLEDQPPRLAGDLRASQHHAVGLNQVGPRALSVGELSLQMVELLVGGADPLLEVRDLGGAIAAQDAPFGDGDLGGDHVRGADGDPARRALTSETRHRSSHDPPRTLSAAAHRCKESRGPRYDFPDIRLRIARTERTTG